MSERKPTKAKLEENEEEQKQTKKPKHQETSEKISILKQDFYVEDPDLIIDEDTDEERKKIFKEALKKIKSIIPDYFESTSSKKKKKKKELEELAKKSELNRINTQFVQMQRQSQQHDKNEREN